MAYAQDYLDPHVVTRDDVGESSPLPETTVDDEAQKGMKRHLASSSVEASLFLMIDAEISPDQARRFAHEALKEAYLLGFYDGSKDGILRGTTVAILNVARHLREALWGEP